MKPSQKKPSTALKSSSFAVILASALAIALGGFASNSQAHDLTVVVENIKQARGQIVVGLFDSPSTFLTKPAQGQLSPASQLSKEGTLTFIFHDLPDGAYAISAFHDLDEDGKLTRNVMGIPTEPYGFSGQAASQFGPPSFQDAAIKLVANSKVTIQLQ